MEITEIRVFLINEKRLKAFVSINMDNCFVIHGLKVIDGNNGLFVAMPSRKRKDGIYKDLAHPLNNETRLMIKDKVLKEYYRELEKRAVKSADPPRD